MFVVLDLETTSTKEVTAKHGILLGAFRLTILGEDEGFQVHYFLALGSEMVDQSFHEVEVSALHGNCKRGIHESIFQVDVYGFNSIQPNEMIK